MGLPSFCFHSCSSLPCFCILAEWCLVSQSKLKGCARTCTKQRQSPCSKAAWSQRYWKGPCGRGAAPPAHTLLSHSICCRAGGLCAKEGCGRGEGGSGIWRGSEGCRGRMLSTWKYALRIYWLPKIQVSNIANPKH